MALLATVGYSLLTLLGLGIDPQQAPNVGPVCRGLCVTDPRGAEYCAVVEQGMVCHVICSGGYYNGLTCNEKEGWSSNLPDCARPKKENETGHVCSSNKITEAQDVEAEALQCNAEDCQKGCSWANRRGECRGSVCVCIRT